METMWYYVKNGTERTGPVPESELLALASSGLVLPGDLVWKEGMSDWIPMNQVPELSGQPAAASPAAASSATPAGYPGIGAAPARRGTSAEIPAGLGGWLTFVGVMNIIGGALMCLVGVLAIVTIVLPLVYIPFGVLLIVAGRALLAGKHAALNAVTFDANVLLFMEKIKRFMVIQGVFYIVSIVFTLLGIIAIIVAIFGMGMSMSDVMQQGQGF